jgi:hypothetical protein
MKIYVFPVHAQNTKLRKEWGLIFDKLKSEILNNVWKTPLLLKLFKLTLSKYHLTVLP